MKHIRDKDLLPYVQSLVTTGILEQNAHLSSGTLLIDVVEYIIQRGEISNPEAFKELLLNNSGEARRPIMTIYEQYQQEIKAKVQCWHAARVAARHATRKTYYCKIHVTR